MRSFSNRYFHFVIASLMSMTIPSILEGGWPIPADTQYVADDPTGVEIDVWKVADDGNGNENHYFISTEAYELTGQHPDPGTYTMYYIFSSPSYTYILPGNTVRVYGEVYRKFSYGGRAWIDSVEFVEVP